MPFRIDGIGDSDTRTSSSSFSSPPDLISPSSSSSSRSTSTPARILAATTLGSPSQSSLGASLPFVNFSSILQTGLNAGGATSSIPTTSNLEPTSTLSNSHITESQSSATSANAASQSNTSSPSLPVGVIVGGSIGGLAVILLAIILLISARKQSRRMRGLGRGTMQMINFKDRPPRNMGVVPFVVSESENTQSSRSASDESSKQLQLQNSSRSPVQSPNQQDVQVIGKRQIGILTPSAGDSSTLLPPGITQTGGRNLEVEQNAGANQPVESLDNHNIITPFVVEESPPSYCMTSGLP